MKLDITNRNEYFIVNMTHLDVNGNNTMTLQAPSSACALTAGEIAAQQYKKMNTT